MKLRLAVSAALMLLVCAAAWGQTATTPPPIRMGLWQYEITNTGAGMPGMGGPHTVITQSCVTPASWTESFRGSGAQQGELKCTTANFHQSAGHVAFDQVCEASRDVRTTTHVEMTVEGDTATHGSVETRISGPGFPGMTVTSRMEGKFLTADCGEIKPGKGRVVSQR